MGKSKQKAPGMSIYTQTAHLKFSTILVEILTLSRFSWVQKFRQAKMWVWGAGGRKLFGPYKKHPKDFPKKISGSLDSLNQLWEEVSFLLSPQTVKLFKLRGGTFQKQFRTFTKKNFLDKLFK